MARRFVFLAVALALMALLPGAALAAAPDQPDHAKAVRALERVKDLRRGNGVQTGRELTPALAELVRRRGALGTDGRRQVAGILARPSDQANDPEKDGWTTSEPAASPLCTAHFCVHWVATTADAPDLTDGPDPGTTPDYVDAMAAAFEKVYACENGALGSNNCDGAPDSLGWPPPKGDGSLGGGTDKTDVYIKDIGGEGIYGYAAPDPQPASATTLFAYLVMDNDYDPSQFPGYADPLPPMEVTAAHEYNHVLQFAIDPIEDLWMFEATSTYAEDKVYPAIDDYLNYLPDWVALMNQPLTAAPADNQSTPTIREDLKIYGSAVWNHWLASQYGDGVVLAAWQAKTPPPSSNSGSFAPGSYSTAIAAQPNGISFSDEFVKFAAASTEWDKPNPGFPDTYPALPRDVTNLVVDGPNTSVSGLNHTTYRLADVTPAAGVNPLTLRATLPSGLDGGIALVGLASGTGDVVKQVKTTTTGGLQAVTLPAGNYDEITAVFVNSDTTENGFSGGDWRFTQDNKSFSKVSIKSGPPPPDPTAVTGDATSIGQTTATLSGTVNAQGQSADYYFEYGTTSLYGSKAPITPTPVSGSNDTAATAAISGLAANTTYHFRLVVEGVSGAVNGTDKTFTTLPAPPPTATTPTGPATTGTTTTPTGPGPDTGSPRKSPALVLALAVTKSRLLAAIKKGLKAKATCSEACSVTVKVLLSAKDAKRLHLRRTVATAKSVGGRSLKLRISKKAAKVLARLPSVRLIVSATAATADQRKSSSSKRIALRR